MGPCKDLHRPYEVGTDPAGEPLNSLALGVQDPPGFLEKVFSAVGVHAR